MKKKIAIWLFKLARRLYPISVTVFEQKEILEPKVCAKAYSIDKKIHSPLQARPSCQVHERSFA